MRRAPFTPLYKARRLQRDRAAARLVGRTPLLNVEPFLRALEKANDALQRAQLAVARRV
jgi:hypothetical protein